VGILPHEELTIRYSPRGLVPATLVGMIYVEILLAIAAWAGVFVTFHMAREQTDLLRTDLKLRLQLKFSDRFDDVRMKGYRKRLAEQLLRNTPHEEIQEDVMNFFEDMGLFFELGYLDERFVWGTFSFYLTRWWSACKEYIVEERNRQNFDQSLFSKFECLVGRVYDIGVKELTRTRETQEPGVDEISEFLQDEARLA